MTTNDLNDSLRAFNTKKQSCLSFIDEVGNVLKAFMHAFPATEDEQSNSVDSLRLSDLELVRQKIQDSTLKILIAGQFKTGKSTAVNALLGEEILPAYSTPCTAVITEVLYGDQARAILSFKPEINVLPDDLYANAVRHIQRHGKKNVPDLEITSSHMGEELENYLVIPMSDKEQKDAVAESPYALCRLFWPLELCKNGAVIIDSPGLNEAAARDKTTMDYVPQADIIIHVLNALQCYGKPDATFISDVENMMGRPPILFLINRYDQVNNDRERERVKQYALSKLTPHSTYGGENTGIFFISAQDALEGRQTQNQALLTKSNLPLFERKIADIFNTERGRIKLGNVKRVVAIVNTLAQQRIPDMQVTFTKDVLELERKFTQCQYHFDDLDKKKADIIRRINKEVQYCEREVWTCLRGFFVDFNTNISTIINNISLPSIEMFDVAASKKRCMEVIREEVTDMLKAASRDCARTQLTPIVQNMIQEINDIIAWDMNQFNAQIASLRQELDLPVFDVKQSQGKSFDVSSYIPEFSSTNIEDFVCSSTGVSMNIIASSPLFALFESIIDALRALFDEDGIHREIKNTAKNILRQRINDEKDEWSKLTTDRLFEQISTISQEISTNLTEQIEGIKRPIQDAIQQLNKNQSEIAAKKTELASFAEQFKQLNQRGQELEASL